MWKSIDVISSRVTATHHVAFMFADTESFLSFCLQSRTGHALHVSALECTNAHATERHMGSVAKLLTSTYWVRIAGLQCIKVIRLMTSQPRYHPFFTCNIWRNKKKQDKSAPWFHSSTHALKQHSRRKERIWRSTITAVSNSSAR